jgi:hypothetical protein
MRFLDRRVDRSGYRRLVGRPGMTALLLWTIVHDGESSLRFRGRVEDWRGAPQARPICLLPVSVGSASLAEP